MLILCQLLKVINKVKVTLQGQGHIKLKSQGQGQMWKIISTHIFICILLQIINMVKVTYQGQSENSMSFQFYVAHTVAQAGGLHSTEMRSCWKYCLAWL